MSAQRPRLPFARCLRNPHNRRSASGQFLSPADAIGVSRRSAELRNRSIGILENERFLGRALWWPLSIEPALNDLCL